MSQFGCSKAPHGEQPLSARGRRDPRCAAGKNGVCEQQQLSGGGDESELVGLSGGDKPAVEGDQVGIPTEGRPGKLRRKGGAQAGATTNMVEARCRPLSHVKGVRPARVVEP